MAINYLDKDEKEYFMIKEILEQKEVFTNLLNQFFDDKLNIDTKQLPMNNWKRIVICASGSSKNASEIARYFIENYAKIPCCVEYASEYAHKDALLSKDDLFIAISQSGNTADTFEALLKAKRAGATTFAITNDKTSKIHTNADYKILADAGLEQSIAATKSFCAQLLILYVFAMALTEKYQKTDLTAMKKEFAQIANCYDDIFAQKSEIKRIAKRLSQAKSVAILGRNINSALAQEGALKTKETCYLNAVHSPSGEFLHGHFAFLDKAVPVIGLVNKTDEDVENYELAMKNLAEIKSKRNVDMILITTKGDTTPSARINNEYGITISSISKWFAPFLSLVVLQLIAYETAILLNDNLDQPRDLIKCVAAE